MSILSRSVESKLPAASNVADLGTEELLSLQQLFRAGCSHGFGTALLEE